jgi:cyclopropane fatty-acyl-phospholipid synthase-like methyltransferase
MTTATKPSVEQMNKVIQTFMGIPIERKTKNFSNEQYRKVSNLLNWHSDWNLLIDAYDKVKRHYYKTYEGNKGQEALKRRFGNIQHCLLEAMIKDLHIEIYEYLLYIASTTLPNSSANSPNPGL